MKKLLLLLVVLIACFTLSASISPSYDAFFRATIVRDSQLAVGGGVSGGVDIGRTRLSLYFLGDYYQDALGGDGFAANREFSLEPGVSAEWQLCQVWKMKIWAGLDIGCFMQFANVWQDPDAGTVFGTKGIMARAKLTAEFAFVKYWGMSLGVYYQLPLAPDYDDYRGLGFLLSIV